LDLNVTPREQLLQHINWLRNEAVDEAPPSQIKWAWLRSAMEDHALFLESFVVRHIPERITERPKDQTKTPEFLTRHLDFAVSDEEQVKVGENNGV